MMTSSQSGTPPSLWQIWWLAARPKTLWAGIAPVVMGTAMAYADGSGHVWSAAVAFAGAVLIQIGTNFCNDYADFKKGADTSERLGPTRATQAGWVTPRAMGWATVLVFALAACCAAYLVVRGGWPVALLAVLALLAGVGYTLGPYALAYLGLGDVFVLIFFGPVAVAGTYYVQAQALHPFVIWAGGAPGLLACAILVVNNLRDVVQDRQANKRTLVVRWGARFARWQYGIMVVSAIVVWPLIGWIGWGQSAWTLLPMLTLVRAWPPLRMVCGGGEGHRLNPVLGQTAQVLIGYAVFFTLGVGLSIL